MQRIFHINDWPLATKLIATMVLVSIIPLAVATTISSLAAGTQIETDLRSVTVEQAKSEGENNGAMLAMQVIALQSGLGTSAVAADAANASNSAYTGSQGSIEAQLLAQDAEWVNAPQIGSPLITQVLNNRLADRIRGYLQINSEQTEVLITDRYGAILAANKRTSHFYQGDEEWWQASWNKGEGAVVIGMPEYDADSGATTISISIPLVDTQSGSVVGVIRAIYNMQVMVDDVRATETDSGRMERMLAPNGTYVVAPRGEDIGQAAPAAQLLDGRIFTGSGFETNVVGEDGQPIVLGYAPVTSNGLVPEVDQLGWVSQIMRDRAAAFAPINQVRIIGVVVALIAALAAAGAALMFARVLMTRQVDEIQKVFRAAAVGNFDARAKVLSRDELGQTADGVNAMLAQLTSLIGRVEEAAQSEIEQIFNTAADGMRLVDRDFNVLRANTTLCEMAGVEPGEALREKCYETFRGPVCHTPGCTLNRIINGEKTIELEVDKQRKDGTTIPCVLVAMPFYGRDGQVVGIVEDFRDITERKQAEQQLQTQNEALANALDELRKLIANVEVAAGQVTGASSSMAEIVQLIAGQATTSAQIAEEATTSAQEGDRAVTDTVAAMGRIRESAQETTRRIKRLGEASQEIGEVVRLIDDIADRVTVLALNASIQAAAAGEAGRGFAVVAEEVQRLAERATNATRQIENMIKTIQGEINEAMIGVEEATHEVVDGSQLAQGAGERISDLNRVIGDLSGLIQHVAQTTTQQTSESLATLATLASDLQASVAALRIPDASHMGGNGNGALVSTPESEG